MKYLKHYLLPILVLIIIDQSIKIVIDRFYMDKNFNILGNIFIFYPIINTKLSWLGNFIPFFSGIIVTIVLNVLLIFIFITGYSFYRSKNSNPSIRVNIIYIFGLAGCFCSFIDKIFWGGSLDYIKIPHFFIFDLKDCYLTIVECLFIIIGVKYSHEISLKDYIKYCLPKKNIKF